VTVTPLFTIVIYGAIFEWRRMCTTLVQMPLYQCFTAIARSSCNSLRSPVRHWKVSHQAFLLTCKTTYFTNLYPLTATWLSFSWLSFMRSAALIGKLACPILALFLTCTKSTWFHSFSSWRHSPDSLTTTLLACVVWPAQSSVGASAHTHTHTNTHIHTHTHASCASTPALSALWRKRCAYPKDIQLPSAHGEHLLF
jgi:hypothetical protein